MRRVVFFALRRRGHAPTCANDWRGAPSPRGGLQWRARRRPPKLSQNCPKTVPNNPRDGKNAFQPMFTGAGRIFDFGTIWGLPWAILSGKGRKKAEAPSLGKEPPICVSPLILLGFMGIFAGCLAGTRTPTSRIRICLQCPIYRGEMNMWDNLGITVAKAPPFLL